MELQSVTAKVDALREKGFSDTEINQLLGTTPQGEGAASISEASVLEALQKGNTQVLQQFSTGKDPEIFNAKVDEIVEFLEKDTKSHMHIAIVGWGIVFSVIILTSILGSLSPEDVFKINGSVLILFIVFKFFQIKSGLKARYRFLKPRLLYFIRK